MISKRNADVNANVKLNVNLNICEYLYTFDPLSTPRHDPGANLTQVEGLGLDK